MMLSTANLRSSQKTKDSVDNAKLNAWAKEQIEKRYAVRFITLFIYLSFNFNLVMFLGQK